MCKRIFDHDEPGQHLSVLSHKYVYLQCTTRLPRGKTASKLLLSLNNHTSTLAEQPWLENLKQKAFKIYIGSWTLVAFKSSSRWLYYVTKVKNPLVYVDIQTPYPTTAIVLDSFGYNKNGH